MRTPVVIVVDPYSSGNLYAPTLRRHGLSPVAVLSAPRPARAVTATFHPDDFDACLDAADGDDRLFDEVRRLAPIAVLPGAQPGVLLADRLADAVTPWYANAPELSGSRNHKGRMVEALRSGGIPVGRSTYTSEVADVEAWIDTEGLQDTDLVVKPAMGASTEGVTLLPGGRGWRPAFESLRGRMIDATGTRTEQVVVQERLRGVEYAINTFSSDGRHWITEFCRYAKLSDDQSFGVYQCAEFLGPGVPEYAALTGYVRATLDVLGFRFGPAHTEVVLTADGPRLIELNARIAGGGMPGAVWLATGDDGVSRTARHLARGPERQADFTLHRSVIVVPFSVRRGGVVTDAEVLREIGELPTCRQLSVRVRTGDRVPATSTLWTSKALGSALLAHRSAERVRADYRRARSIIDGLGVRP